MLASRLSKVEYFVTAQYIARHYQRLPASAVYFAGNFVQARNPARCDSKVASLGAKLPG